MEHVSLIFNTIAADVILTQGDKASAPMVMECSYLPR